MRQPRKVSVFPPKPERLQIYVIHTLGIKAPTCFAGGIEKLSISLSKRKASCRTNGANHRWSRSRLLQELTWQRWDWAEREFMLVLHLTLAYPGVFLTPGCLSFKVWADHAVCLWFSRDLAKRRPGLISPTRGQVYDSSSSTALGSQPCWVIVLSCQADELLKHLTTVNSLTYLWPFTCPGYRPSGGQGHKQKSRSFGEIQIRCLLSKFIVWLA